MWWTEKSSVIDTQTASQRSILQHWAHNCLRQKQVLMQRSATNHNIGSPWITCRGISSLWQIYSHGCYEHWVHTLSKVQNNCRRFGCQFKRWFYYAHCNIAVLIQGGLFGVMTDSKVNILLSTRWHIPQPLAQHFKECCSHRLKNNPNHRDINMLSRRWLFFWFNKWNKNKLQHGSIPSESSYGPKKIQSCICSEETKQLQCFAAII